MSVQNYLNGDSAVNIATSVEAAIAAGRAGGGERLPPVRALAERLGVSPATVAAAYRGLQARGVVVADGRRGTRIRHAAPIASPAAAPLPPGVQDLASGNPDPDLLPPFASAIRQIGITQRLYRDDLVDEQLRGLAREQFESDGVHCGDVAVVSGALDGIERVLRGHLRPGDRVAVEDPCFTGVADLLHSLALVPIPIEMDDEGPLPDRFARALRNAHAVVVTPRAQNPTGAAISRSRAKSLRATLAQRGEVLLVEDDHAGPVAGAPYVTLTSRTTKRWVAVRSVSKWLGPDLRVAVMTGDGATLARVSGQQILGIRWVSHILQRLVAQLWRDPATKRLLVRAEWTYAERRTALVRELTERGIEAHGSSGLNVWIPLPEESAVVQTLFQRGWAVQAGERYRIRTRPAIRVTTASLTECDAERFASDLASILRPSQRSSPA